MKIEICCGSYRDALEAYDGRADRIELCSGLFFGGLTPSFGSFLLAKENTNLDIAVMLRPREGGFCYSYEEFKLLLEEGLIFLKHGADALVFGCLNADSTINYDGVKRMCDMVRGRCELVFHRAFDVSSSPMEEAVIKLRELGITRILTSGRKKTALEGAENIKKMINIGGIEILPAGSVRIQNLAELHQKTGCTWAHTSALKTHIDSSANHDEILFTGTSLPRQGEYSKADCEIIADIVKLGRNLGEDIRF